MNNTNFAFVQYRKLKYPDGIEVKLKEVAGHLDKEEIIEEDDYSLHTEYSFMSRKLDSETLLKYPELKNANKRGVPQLWYSIDWAREFALFVIDITQYSKPPKVIEIHPPYNDYCSMDEFIERYNCFEKIVHDKYPNTKIVIENRSGTRYSGGKFLISTTEDIVELCCIIQDKSLNLRLVLDYPQLLTAEHIETVRFDELKYKLIIEMIKPYKDLIDGIHLWGKKRNARGWTSHVGTLDTYFDDNKENKKIFLDGIMEVCNDYKERYFVPEVNSGQEDMNAIVKDVLDYQK